MIERANFSNSLSQVLKRSSSTFAHFVVAVMSKLMKTAIFTTAVLKFTLFLTIL